MSKQANKTVIGAFVIGAVILAIIGIMIFGSGQFLKEKYPYVLYFEGSVKGLDVGASVDFRGVKIGTVTGIVLLANTDDLSLDIIVYIEIEPDRMKRVGSNKVRLGPEKSMKLLVEKGLRGQLEMQSLVTGKLMIELDFYEDKPAVYHDIDPDYTEIPTVQSDLAQLAERIEKVPLEEIFEKLHSAVSGIEEVVNSPEIIESIRSLERTLNATEELVNNVNDRVGPLATGLDGTIKDTRHLINNVNAQVEPVSSRVKKAIEQASIALDQADDTLKSVEQSAGKDAVVVYELTVALKEISKAARSIGLLADYLAQHPESLIKGKKGGSE
jgi:paraquat-inducible protein B